VYTALRAIDSLKILLSPFLPFTSQRLHGFFGYEDQLFGVQSTETIQDAVGEHLALRYNHENAAGRWEPSRLTPGRQLNSPSPLFKKLDASIVAEERARLGMPAAK
jgi:methionyl-tRNA synthetase